MAYIFNPSVWTYQVSPGSVQPFPSCLVEGDDTFKYDGLSQFFPRKLTCSFSSNEMTRALDASLCLGPLVWWGTPKDYQNDDIVKLADCSVTSQALDQIHPATMQHFVWSWAVDQPDGSSPCTSINAEGRWESTPCETFLPHACVSINDERDWLITESAGAWSNVTCPTSYEFGLPEVGFTNSFLRQAAGGVRTWLNYFN